MLHILESPAPVTSAPSLVLSPPYQSTFTCLAGACPDTCCDGFRIAVDKKTYDRYQSCSDTELAPRLAEFVRIDPASRSDNTYAGIQLTSPECPFLAADKLCGIQSKLGEDWLPNTCATFPRIVNKSGYTTEISLDLSCPEAARLALLDPAPMRFYLRPAGAPTPPSVATSNNWAVTPAYFSETRRLIFSVLQNRRYSVPARLTLLAHICDKLAANTEPETVPTILDGFTYAIDNGLFDAHLSEIPANSAVQLSVVLELIVSRIQADAVPRRFLIAYAQFMQGLGWTEQSTMADISARYQEAYSNVYQPFMAKHAYILENYLVAYTFKTLFPLGGDVANRMMNVNQLGHPIRVHYLQLAAHFAIVKTLLIGLSGLHGEAFAAEHVVDTIQACSKALDHIPSFGSQVVNLLAGKGINGPAAASVLIQN